MEPTFRPKLNEQQRILEGQIRECYGKVVYSHKTHEKCADILLTRQSWLKNAQIGLSACTTGCLVSVFLGTGRIGTIISALLSSILLFLNAYAKNYDLGELAQKHKQAANEIWIIREKLLSLLVDLLIGEKSIIAIQSERDSYLEALHQAYSGAPSTTTSGYKRAQKALKFDEDMTFSDQEIDVFLPKELRRT